MCINLYIIFCYYHHILTGIVGIILRFLTPLTIAPAVSMIGLSLFHVASQMGEKNWTAYIGLVNHPETKFPRGRQEAEKVSPF